MQPLGTVRQTVKAYLFSKTAPYSNCTYVTADRATSSIDVDVKRPLNEKGTVESVGSLGAKLGALA